LGKSIKNPLADAILLGVEINNTIIK